MSTTTNHTTPLDDPPPPDAAPRLAAPQQAAPRQATPRSASPTGAPDQGTSRIYRGRTVDELIPKIQADLGEDAIVVRHHKGLTGGFAGFFQRPFVEIEARQGAPRIDRYDEDQAAPALPGRLAQEPETEPDSAPVPESEDEQLRAGTPPSRVPRTPPGAWESYEEQFRELTPASLLGQASVEPPPELNGSPRPPTVWDADPFAAALAEAEAAILPAEAAILAVEPAILQTTPAHVQSPSAAISSPTGRARAAIERALLEVGIDQELVDELIEAAVAHVRPLMPSRPSLARAIHAALAQRIPVCAPLPATGATIALVGPGGSGKTACCAALLGAYRKSSTLPAAYATLLEGSTRTELAIRVLPHIPQPLPVADPRVDSALRSARDGGLVLLDTPPLSPGDRGAIRTLATLLAQLRPDRVVLALPATLGAKPAAQLLQALHPLNADALAITHADETDQLGVAVAAACASGLAPTYLVERSERGRPGGGLTRIDPIHLADRLLPQR